MSREHDEKGRFAEKADLEDVLTVFDDVEGPPVVTSPDIAQRLDVSRETARRKLSKLADAGLVRSRSPSQRLTLYWRVNDPDSGSGDEEDGR